MVAKRFRKLPVEIEAMQWNGDNGSAVYDWMLVNDEKAFLRKIDDERGHSLAIDTLEGVMRANKNDWIIRGVNGEFYPCKPDIFEKTYQAVD
jgi:hypothetical protein